MALTQESIGKRLREARLNLKLSQEQAAAAVGLDRTALLKIEKGSRAVTSTELVRLARLYRREMSELLSEEPLVEDSFTLLGRMAGNGLPGQSDEVMRALELLKEAVRLEELLGDRFRETPPLYSRSPPVNYEDAIDQGKEVALLERRRLGLGRNAIPDVAEVIASQGIWTAAVPLPEETMGLFIAHRRFGLAVFVNQANQRARRRFSYAHEYAHALMDRDQVPEPTSRENAHTLKEKRANAFASEFLMPAEGLLEALHRCNKGGVGRGAAWTYDFFAPASYVKDAVRVDAEAQRISLHDTAFLARYFRVSYEMAAIRLKDVGIISKGVLDQLLAQKERAWTLMRALRMEEPEEEGHQPWLERQVMELAFECFRRDRISRGRFVQACILAEKDPEEMLTVAQAE